MCIAGHTCKVAGVLNPLDNRENRFMEGCEEGRIRSLAAELLGITYIESIQLFFAFNWAGEFMVHGHVNPQKMRAATVRYLDHLIATEKRKLEPTAEAMQQIDTLLAEANQQEELVTA
jgi:hypothetical protein